ALKSGREINKVLISEQINKQTEKELQQLAKKSNTIVQKVPKQKLDQMTSGKHQGMVAYVSSYNYSSVEEILQRAEAKEEAPLLIILDELEDPHNLGAILRSADATGAHGVIIPKRRAVGLTETVAKAYASAIGHICVAWVNR